MPAAHISIQVLQCIAPALAPAHSLIPPPPSLPMLHAPEPEVAARVRERQAAPEHARGSSIRSSSSSSSSSIVIMSSRHVKLDVIRRQMPVHLRVPAPHDKITWNKIQGQRQMIQSLLKLRANNKIPQGTIPPPTPTHCKHA